MLGKVEAVTDDELVGALEADIAARDVGLGRRVLAHERRHRKRRRLAGLQVLQEVLQREP